MKITKRNQRSIGLVVVGVAALAVLTSVTMLGCGKGGSTAPSLTMLNVSYDPTRELYRDVNKAFAELWKQEHGQTVELNTSNGGSGKQARSVIDGQEADVITLALAYDIDMIQKKTGNLAKDWQSRLPHNSCPYTSTIVFLVRAGNPKGIKDWDDLLRDGIEIVTPDPQTSGGARWNYLAAWGYVLRKELGSLSKLNDPAAADQVAKAQKKAREYVAQMFRHVPVRDTGARGATNRFVRGAGDVLLAWENEALLQKSQGDGDKFEIVTPSLSILAEPPVAVMDKIVDKHGTRPLAEAYLKFLYSPAGQDIVAKHYYRPRVPEFAEKYKSRFPQVELFTIDAVFGGWENAQKTHFDQGGVFEQIQKP
jgi:sulfate transport system substrate-binding protein